MTKQIIRNIASNYARMFFQIVSALFLMPLILNRLGPEALGLWVLTSTVAGYFSLMDLGITSAAIKYISHYRATAEWDELNHVISNSLSFFSILAVLVLLVGFFAGHLAPAMFHMPVALVPTARILFVLVGVVAAFGFASVIPIQCTIAAQRQDLLNMWMLLVQVICTALSLTAVFLGKSIIWLGGIQVVSSLCNVVIGFTLARKYLPQAKFALGWHRDRFSLLASFAGIALLGTLAGKIIYSTDAIVIAHVLTMAAVAGYTIALKIAQFMKSIVYCASGVLGTFVCESAAYGDTKSLADMWVEGTKWALAMTLPVLTLCVLCGNDLVSSWIGKTYPEAAAVLTILAYGVVIDTAQSAGFQILFNAGKAKIYTLVLCAEAAVNLSLSLLLIGPMGITGVAIGTAIPQILRASIFCPWLLTKITGVHLNSYVTRAILPAFQACALPVLLIAIYKMFGFHTGRISLFSLALIVAPGELLGVYIFCLTSEQRNAVRRKVLRYFSPPISSNEKRPVAALRR